MNGLFGDGKVDSGDRFRVIIQFIPETRIRFEHLDESSLASKSGLVVGQIVEVPLTGPVLTLDPIHATANRVISDHSTFGSHVPSRFAFQHMERAPGSVFKTGPGAPILIIEWSRFSFR